MSNRALRTLTAVLALTTALGLAAPATAADRPVHHPVAQAGSARQWLADLLTVWLGVAPGGRLATVAGEEGHIIDPNGLAATPQDEGHVSDPDGLAATPRDHDPNG